MLADDGERPEVVVDVGNRVLATTEGVTGSRSLVPLVTIEGVANVDKERKPDDSELSELNPEGAVLLTRPRDLGTGLKLTISWPVAPLVIVTG